MATFMAGVAVAGLVVRGRARRDGGAIRIPVTAAAAVDPTDGDVWRAMTTRAWSPITRLRAAILVQALADLRAPPDTKVGAEVRTWFASEDLGDPCAFVPICETLGLDPDAVRAQVLSARQAVIAAPVHRVDRRRVLESPHHGPGLSDAHRSRTAQEMSWNPGEIARTV